MRMLVGSGRVLLLLVSGGMGWDGMGWDRWRSGSVTGLPGELVFRGKSRMSKCIEGLYSCRRGF